MAQTTYAIWAKKPSETWHHVGDEMAPTRGAAIAFFITAESSNFPPGTEWNARKDTDPELIFETQA